jgi:hypothetical protein
MDFDFARIFADDVQAREDARNEIIPLFKNPAFLLDLVARLDDHAPQTDEYIQGLLCTILSMVRVQFDPQSSCPQAVASCVLDRLFSALFRPGPLYRPYVQATFRSLLKARCPLADCAEQCLRVLSQPPSERCDALPSVGFLNDFVRVRPIDMDEEGLTGLCSRFLVSLTPHLRQFHTMASFPFLELTSTSLSCLARFFSLGVGHSLDLRDGNALKTCWECGVQALQMTDSDDSFAREKARIAKAFSRSFSCVPKSSFAQDPEVSALCEHLVHVSVEILSSTGQSFLKCALLLLLQSIMSLSPQPNSLVAEALTPDVLVAAVRLSPADIDDFDTFPVVYLDRFMGLDPECRPLTHRSALAELFDLMHGDDALILLERVLAVGFPEDPLDLEAYFFLTNCLAALLEKESPAVCVEAAVSLLGTDVHVVTAAALLMCLSRAKRNEFLAEASLAAADQYMASPSLVVRHAALRLFRETIPFTSLEESTAAGLVQVLLELAANAWHPHLLSVFAGVIALRFPSGVSFAREIFVHLVQNWSWLVGDAPDDMVTLLGFLLKMLPRDNPELMEWAGCMGDWFLDPCEGFILSRVMKIAILVADALVVVPLEFFNVLCFCGELFNENVDFVNQFSDLCVLLIRSCHGHPDAPPCDLMYDMCERILTAQVIQDPAPDIISRMLMVEASFVQSRGLADEQLIGFTLGLFLNNPSDTQLWSSALIVLLSVIIISPFLTPIPDFVERLVPQLEPWFLFSDCDRRATLPLCRLSVLSITAFLVLAMTGNDAALRLAIKQVARLENDRPDGPLDKLERMCLPFDQVNVDLLLANFDHSYQGSWAAVCSADRWLSFVTLRITEEELVGFLEYLLKFLG